MAPWLWWTLAGTVFLAVIVAFAAFFITRAKIHKIRDQYLKVAQSPEDIEKELAAYQREDHGVLLWEEKNKVKDPLEDEEMELAINTIIRNKYKNAFILNSKSEYEEISFKKLAKATIVKEPGNFNLIFNNESINNDFDQVYKTMKAKDMIFIANAKQKDKEIKRLLRYLKTSKIRHEWQPVGLGVVLVVK